MITLSPFQNARRAACSVAPTGALSPEFEPPACYPGAGFLEGEVLSDDELQRHELAWPDDVPISFVRSLSI